MVVRLILCICTWILTPSNCCCTFKQYQRSTTSKSCAHACMLVLNLMQSTCTGNFIVYRKDFLCLLIIPNTCIITHTHTTHTQTLSLSLSVSFTHTHTHTNTHTHTLSPFFLSHTHINTNTHSWRWQPKTSKLCSHLRQRSLKKWLVSCSRSSQQTQRNNSSSSSMSLERNQKRLQRKRPMLPKRKTRKKLLPGDGRPQLTTMSSRFFFMFEFSKHRDSIYVCVCVLVDCMTLVKKCWQKYFYVCRCVECCCWTLSFDVAVFSLLFVCVCVHVLLHEHVYMSMYILPCC